MKRKGDFGIALFAEMIVGAVRTICLRWVNAQYAKKDTVGVTGNWCCDIAVGASTNTVIALTVIGVLCY